jgi:hypothetical protein
MSDDDVLVGEKLGFDVVSVLLRCRSVVELDSCIRIVNLAYPILRGQLETLDDIENKVEEVL